MTAHTASRRLIIAATASAVVFSVGGYVLKEHNRPRALEVYIFNLKSGRSMFIRTPDDRRILVDGGANSDIVREITGILPFYSRRIDVVMATHGFDKDVSGLIDVLNRYTVDNLYVPKYLTASSSGTAYSILLKTAAARHINVSAAQAGNTMLLDRDVAMKILFPLTPQEFAYSAASGPEIIFKLVYGATSILSLGSSSRKVQRFLARAQGTSSALGALDHVDVAVYDSAMIAANVSEDLMTILQPNYVVYAKRVSAAGARAAAVSEQRSYDPLAGILADHRWNIREKGTIRIISDGKTVHF
ncbi:MAG: hypothetical protein KGI59_02785 [Patescibacteria group bacterium]|nr:hypothetical protein [Patescibacteria group bacterium]MDE2172426.1 hypothetical protein [Patescibacteria group bacterium]